MAQFSLFHSDSRERFFPLGENRIGDISDVSLVLSYGWIIIPLNTVLC